MDLQCLFIGQQSKLYADLVNTLNELDINAQMKLVGIKRERVLLALKRLKGASLIFISDEVAFSLEELSDLVWRFSPDAIVVILAKKAVSSKLVKPFNTTQFTKLRFKKDDEDVSLFLMCLVQTVQLKADFRRCKRLLGVSEKRCQWLVESSQEAIAYITRDLHIYANSSYLALFDINSVQRLRATPVKDLIDDGEYVLFNNFISSQLQKHTLNHSVVISMRKINGEVFRVNLHVVPSVYKGVKCLQLWVGVVDKFPKQTNKFDVIDTEKNKIVGVDLQHEGQKALKTGEEPNPFAVLEKKTGPNQEQKRVIDTSAILSEIIKREEASLSAQKLRKMVKSDNLNDHHMLSLKMDQPQRDGVNSLLFDPLTKDALKRKQIFWDKVKFTKLFQVLSRRSGLEMNLLVEISVISISDQEFRDWLKVGISKLGAKASSLVFVISSQFSDDEKEDIAHFVDKLKAYHCKILMDEFTASSQALNILKALTPDYVRLSLEWIKKIKGHNKREKALSNYIQQIEKRNIKVIVPCSSDRVMREIFKLSGASFCQERNIKKD